MAATAATRLAPISVIQLILNGPQSITDYPLRNQAMLAFAGFALLLLARGAVERERTRA